MRMLAALMVLVSHQYLLAGRPELRVLGLYSLGDVGVAMFFGISGYLVTTSWMHDPHLLRFFARRFLRIYPALLVIVLLLALGVGPLFAPMPLSDYFFNPRFGTFFQNLILRAHTDLPVQIGNGPFSHIVNGSLWTIPLEVRCYVLLSLIGMLGLLRWRLGLPALMLAFAAYHLGWLGPGAFLIRADEGGRSLQLEFIACFFLGACVARFPGLLRAPRVWIWLVMLLGLGGGAWAWGQPALAIWLVVPLTTLAVGNACWPLLSGVGRWGDFSYGVYLYAFPVQQIVLADTPAALPFALQLVLAVALTLLCSAVSWHTVEKRALRRKPRARQPQ